jgi:hypothetical protein
MQKFVNTLRQRASGSLYKTEENVNIFVRLEHTSSALTNSQLGLRHLRLLYLAVCLRWKGKIQTCQIRKDSRNQESKTENDTRSPVPY